MAKLKNRVTVNGKDVWNASALASREKLPVNAKQRCSRASEALHKII